jgi:hypothetical protein
LNRLALSGLIAAALLASPLSQAKSSSFEVANNTGATLTAIYTGPTGQAEWGPNILDGQVASGKTVTITLEEATGCDFDFRYDFAGKESFEEYKIDICKIDGQKFEIKSP